jgi:hypothetical protein
LALKQDLFLLLQFAQFLRCRSFWQAGRLQVFWRLRHRASGRNQRRHTAQGRFLVFVFGIASPPGFYTGHDTLENACRGKSSFGCAVVERIGRSTLKMLNRAAISGQVGHFSGGRWVRSWPEVTVHGMLSHRNHQKHDVDDCSFFEALGYFQFSVHPMEKSAVVH